MTWRSFCPRQARQPRFTRRALKNSPLEILFFVSKNEKALQLNLEAPMVLVVPGDQPRQEDLLDQGSPADLVGRNSPSVQLDLHFLVFRVNLVSLETRVDLENPSAPKNR